MSNVNTIVAQLRAARALYDASTPETIEANDASYEAALERFCAIKGATISEIDTMAGVLQADLREAVAAVQEAVAADPQAVPPNPLRWDTALISETIFENLHALAMRSAG